MNSAARATPSSSGEPVFFSTASLVCKMLRVPVGRGAFPPDEQLEVITLATSKTSEHDCVASQWSLDDLAAVLVNRHADEAMTRSTIWRVLNAADLKPHRSVYWLNSHDPDFDAKSQDICKLYVQAPVLYQHGELVICTDEKTGMQILERKHPTIPVQPGKPEKREHEYIRHGVRCLIASFIVPTGKVVWDLGVTRTSRDFAAHLAHVDSQFPDQQRFHWVLDNLNTHWSLDVCELLARLNGLPFHKKDLRTGAQRRAFLTDPEHKHVFHYTPKHGSWLNQVELWFSTLARRFLKRGDFASAQEFITRLTAYLDDHNAQRAHPYRWTYTGQPLVRATPFSQTRRQQRHGRAWFGTRPQLFDRSLYPPRPYKRTPTDNCSGTCKMAIYFVYRAASEKINRGMYLIQSADQGKSFAGVQLDNWKIDTCPMSSEAFAEGPTGVYTAWDTQGQIYFARIQSGKAAVDTPKSVPGHGGNRKHPALAVNKNGDVIVVWTEGTGWNRGGDLAWQVYGRSGKATAESGRRQGVIPVWGLPTVIAEPDGRFTIMH